MKRGLALNALLGVVAAGLTGYIAWEMVRPTPAPRPARTREAPAAAAPASHPVPEIPAPPGAYGIIASRNLFNPSRSDAPGASGAAGAAQAVQGLKPNLFGVVLREGASLAYLEDPVTKRVAGYRIGDTVAGSTVKSIDADRVVLARPEGTIDVRLHDPSRPRPALPVTPVAPVVPGRGPLPPTTPQLPGVIPPVTAQPPMAPQPQVQGPVPPTGPRPQVFTPGRRPLPPNLLRRFQLNQPGNAPTQ